MYIPYRDSKLTCLLRQSLGGNSTTIMIACLQPSDHFFEENQSTLEYASKAALISNKPVKNDDPKTKLIMKLKGQVRSLTMELLRANQHIEYLSAVCGQSIKKFGSAFMPTTIQAQALLQTSEKRSNGASQSTSMLPKISQTRNESNIIIENSRSKK